MYKKILSIAMCTMMLTLTACGGKSDKTVTTAKVTEEQTVETTTEETTTEEVTTEEITSEETAPETTTVEETETTTELVTESTTPETTEVTTVAQETTTKKKQTTTKKPEKTTSKKEEQTTEFIEDGMSVWKYRSNIYANDPVKSELETIFWNEYGWTSFSAAKNDTMVKAMVELVYDIMQNNETDFEREMALYEAICLSCRYDYESLETGLTREGQTPYGVLIEHKSVCGGYAGTFSMGLSMMGIENNLITGSVKEGGMHAWNQVCLDGEWYEVDATWGDNTCDNCPSGDCECTFDYDYFNVTSERLAYTHNVRGQDCTGTKYNEDYLREKYTGEYLEGKVYYETVEECMNYINSYLENGNSAVSVYAPLEVWLEILDIINDYDVWKELYPLPEIVTKNNYQYGYCCERGQRYKYVRMEHVGEIYIELYSVDKFREGGNFFENYDEMLLYMDEQLRSGSEEVVVYYNFPRDFSLNGDLEILNQGRYHMYFSEADAEFESFESINMIRITPYIEEDT